MHVDDPMLVLKLEVWPAGDSSRRQPLGTLEVANDETSTSEETGNYIAVLKRTGRATTHETVKDFPRAHGQGHAWKLAVEALKKFAL